MTSEIKRKSVSAVAWSATETLFGTGIQFCFSIVLARLLVPEQFGIIAMLFFFTGLAGSFVDAGFTTAIVQKNAVTQDETSSVFFFNVAAGLLTAVLICAGASWMAAFYDAPVLKPLAYFMALNLFLGSLGGVQRALLTKDLDFQTQTRITALATLLSGAIAVTLAWRGWGVWSLAVQMLTSTVLTTGLLWWWRPWRPSARFSLSALKPLFRFGSYLFCSSLLNTIYTRLYTLLIGKIYSSADLGQYARADTTQQVPASLLTSVVNRVAFPVFSAVAQDDQLLRSGMRQAVTQTMLLNLPVSLGLLAVARPLVLSLFGEPWAPCIPYLQVLCLAGVLWPVHVLNLSCLSARGRSDLVLKLEVWKKVLGVAAILTSAQISVMAMAWAQVALSGVCFFLNAHYTGVLLGYSPLHQLRDLLPATGATAVMLGVVLAIRLIGLESPLTQLIVQVFAGAAVFWAVCRTANIAAYCNLRQQLSDWLVTRNGTDAKAT
jgi:O-antigen/teichoic acid export membrane protein